MTLSRQLLRMVKTPSNIKAKMVASGGLWIAVFLTILMLPPSVAADPLDYNPRWSVGGEGFISTIRGCMGFEQQPGGYGTLNDLATDLGLPTGNMTFRFGASVRPLEHHLLRVYGSIPEYYKGSTPVPRELRFTQLPNPGFNVGGVATTVLAGTSLAITVPVGSPVSLEMRYASYGLGYDLDFLVAPNWLAGFNSEFKYLDLKMRIFAPGAYNGICPAEPCGALQNNFTDNISVDELFPCVGGHGQVVFPCGGTVGFGGFTRMNFGITPNYLNYVDITMGLSFRAGVSNAPVVMARLGYEHESIFHDTNNRKGRVMELKRDGILFSLDASF